MRAPRSSRPDAVAAGLSARARPLTRRPAGARSARSAASPLRCRRPVARPSAEAARTSEDLRPAPIRATRRVRHPLSSRCSGRRYAAASSPIGEVPPRPQMRGARSPQTAIAMSTARRPDRGPSRCRVPRQVARQAAAAGAEHCSRRCCTGGGTASTGGAAAAGVSGSQGAASVLLTLRVIHP